MKQIHGCIGKTLWTKRKTAERMLCYSKVIIQHCLLHSLLANSTLLFTTDEQRLCHSEHLWIGGEGNAWAHLAEKATNVPPSTPTEIHILTPRFDTSLILGFKRGCWKLLLSINNLPTDNSPLLSFQILPYSFTTPSPMWTFTNCKKLISVTKQFDLVHWSLIGLLCLIITLTKFAKVWAVTSVSYGAKTVQHLHTHIHI